MPIRFLELVHFIEHLPGHVPVYLLLRFFVLLHRHRSAACVLIIIILLQIDKHLILHIVILHANANVPLLVGKHVFLRTQLYLARQFSV